MVFTEWSSGWIKEGHFISFLRDNVRYFEYVLLRDLGHWEYPWFETISSGAESGPVVLENLEITRGYSDRTKMNRVWQLIFGIKGQVEIYVELPTDVHRHGIPKDPKPSTSNRYTSHFEEYMSPFYEPSFLTEHFLMRPENTQIALSAFNPSSASDATTMYGVRINFFINKMITERVGTVTFDTAGLSMEPTSDRWRETLEKLWRAQIPCRPITLLPVIAPAVAPAGE